jgi:pilus assembly protein CpaC
LSLFALDRKLNLSAFLKGPSNQSILQMLAETANFQAGGEIPIPVVESGANPGAITLRFRNIGLNPTFTPTITTGTSIAMHLKQEVSTPDLVDAATLNGFTIRAMSAGSAESAAEFGGWAGLS